MVPRFNFRPGTDQEARNLGPPEIAGESKCAVPSVIARLVSKRFRGVADKHARDVCRKTEDANIYYSPSVCRSRAGGRERDK